MIGRLEAQAAPQRRCLTLTAEYKYYIMMYNIIL